MKRRYFILFLSLSLFSTFLLLSGHVTKDPSSRFYLSKKGICMTTKGGKDWEGRLKKLKVSWHYNWAAKLPKAELNEIDFVPMIWGYWGNSDGFKHTIRKLHKENLSGKEEHLLSFNEPDKKNQSNLSVDRALKAWTYLEWTGLRLGSPATVHPDNEWIREFMAKAKKNNRRVDFVTVHWYGGANPDSLIARLKKIHQLYDKPIWITEFAVGDWNAKTRAGNKYSEQRVLQFMREVLPRLDKLDFVERYAWYSGGQNSAALGSSALWENDGTLTALGKYYSSHH